MNRRFLSTFLIIAAVGGALLTDAVKAGDQPAAAPQGAQVTIYNYKFDPEVLTIPAGTTVTWTNKDEVPHSVVSSDQRFKQSGGLDTGDKYSYTFTDAGSYEYFCSLHPFMKAKVVVTAK